MADLLVHKATVEINTMLNNLGCAYITSQARGNEINMGVCRSF